MEKFKPEEYGYTRFNRHNKKGFYRRFANGEGIVNNMAATIDPDYTLSQARKDAALQTAAKKLYLENWIKQISLTAVFAIRGSDFVRNGHKRALEKMGPLGDSILNTFIFVCRWVGFLFFVPMAIFVCYRGIKARRFDYMGLTLPALYGFSIHAVATHFISRYSDQLAPIFILIFVFGLSLMVKTRAIE